MSDYDPLTLAEFTKRIMRPMILSGIKSGSYDGILAQMLEDYASGEIMFDKEIIKAMVDRVFIIATTPLQEPLPGKVGAQLRIRLPKGWATQK